MSGTVMRRHLHALLLGIGAVAFVAGILGAPLEVSIEIRGPLFQVAAAAFALAIVAARPIETELP